ncbi:hypothetical protein F5877DRAFT_73363 [Lentinula edodes]|nr:hypothetical protein F5877DRAFT_73363 [Lentinula edodes]
MAPLSSLKLGNLMGITTMQAWIYWLRYSDRDRFLIKAVVLIVWCIEFLRSCFAVHAVYHYVIVEWGNPDALEDSIWSIDLYNTQTASLFQAIIQIIVHCYFAYRVKILSKDNWLLIGSIIVLALANFAIAADVTITFSLLFYVSRFRSQVDEKRTLPMMNRLIFYLINIGIVTSTFLTMFLFSVGDIVVLILSDIHTASPTLKYYALYEVVGNFYANSLLATFNTRDGLRNIHDAAAADGSLAQNHNQDTNLVFAVGSPSENILLDTLF